MDEYGHSADEGLSGVLVVVRKDGETVQVPYVNPVDVDELIEAIEEIRDLEFLGVVSKPA